MLLLAALALADAPADRPIVYGYHAYWTDDPATLDLSRLTHLAIFNVGYDGDGHLTSLSHWTDVAGTVVPLAHAAGVKVHLCVTAFEDWEHDAIFQDATARATLIDELAYVVAAYGADGVNVDFEGMSSSYLGELVEFVAELRARVGEVVVATPAVDWSGAYDYPRLAAESDGLFIMGYGYHWTGGDPGPNDPLYGGDPWSKWSLEWTVNDYLDTGADPAKIILGLPLYGQVWEADHSVPGTATGGAWSITMENAADEAGSYGAQYDSVSRSWYYLPPGEQVWYPTQSSVQERIAYAVSREIGGVGFWALDYEGRDPAFWDMVDATAQWPTPEDTGTPEDTDPPGDSGTSGDTDSPGDTDDGSERPGTQSGLSSRIPAEGCAGAPGLVLLLLAGRFSAFRSGRFPTRSGR